MKRGDNTGRINSEGGEVTEPPRGSENQTKKKSDSRLGIEPRTIVYARWRIYYSPVFNSQPRHRFFLCLILTASRVFCDFLSFSINPLRVISSLHYIPIRLVKARVF